MRSQPTAAASRSRGFTLVELLVVIAIIGVLASILVVGVTAYRDRARDSRIVQEVASFQKAAALFLASNGRYPDPGSQGTNAASACVIAIPGDYEKCCVSESGCTYDGTPLDPLSGGDFAAGARAPRWLTLIGERAHAFLDGALPRLLSEAPVASTEGYQGVFYDCTDETCADAHVYFTLASDTCTRGVAHNDLAGVCAQNVASFDEDGSASGAVAEDCSASGDEDLDGAADCDDSDCSSSVSCTCGDGACSADESCITDCPSETHCSDGDDNDQDGIVDCADSDCFGGSCSPEGSNGGSCSDGFDNDADGNGDTSDQDCVTCPDGSCVEGESCSGDCAGETHCSDAVDNDQDGLTDGNDGDCVTTCPNGTCASGESCSADCGGETHCADGVDNDQDGGSDCGDSDCSGDASCGSGGGTTCPDNSCNAHESCSADCSTETHCSDVIDNDEDGSTDCADGDCSGDSSCSGGGTCPDYTCAEGESCSADCPSENWCMDWVDNDGDSQTDGSDPDCW